MKTLKTFLAEAPKIEAMDWKDAFKMLMFHAIETEGMNFDDDVEKVKESYVEMVEDLRSDGLGEWASMDPDEQEEEWDDDFDKFFNDEYWEENSDDVTIGAAAKKVELKSATAEDLFTDSEESPGPYGDPSGGMPDNGEGQLEHMMSNIYREAEGWKNMIMKFGGFKGAGKQMAIDAKKKIKTDWKLINPDELIKNTTDLLNGFTKTTPTHAISKLMLKPNFGINADKKEWANFCKKPETYDRKWWVSLQKEFGKYT